ncbi:PH domain-containing protein [Stenotrophomonas sp. SY1]|jgi:membrane protein YdbS with pleckstrin-like domain|uniref:PH domain-containing protein n=1 Tax=Stenotrophomonas sp. SY1 TaxID=477235 RepID=UPI001E627ABF|nr:PH domain-containing protein [Stenotrophomonas sp. SY1]MCD9085674.1 PH domain-containing protein [Stenotrophomonas sp. SY1]
MTEPPALPEQTLPAHETDWQSLPARGAVFAAIGGGIAMAIPLTLAAGILAQVARYPHWLLAGCAGMVAGLLLGAWFGWRRHRLTFWRLDAQALGVRRGHLWQSESHVPISRVQHLDLRRGPLERAAGLATLIVHTAGTRMNTVAVPSLEQADAERLRDRLARQLDHDDDAL